MRGTVRDCVNESVSFSLSPSLPGYTMPLCVTVSVRDCECEVLCMQDCVNGVSDYVYIRDCVQSPVQCPTGGFTHPAFQVVYRSGSSPVERGDSIKMAETAMHSGAGDVGRFCRH